MFEENSIHADPRRTVRRGKVITPVGQRSVMTQTIFVQNFRVYLLEINGVKFCDQAQ